MTALPTLVLSLALAGAAQDTEPLLAELRALEEMDLDGELVGRGRAAVAPGGALARNGEAVALVARSLADLGDEAGAAELLAGADPTPGTRAWVTLERARLALARDELNAALDRLGDRSPAGLALEHPEHPESWLLAGRALGRAAERKTARPFFERFLELAPLHPEAPSAWYQLELEAVDRRDLERAAACRAEKERLEHWHAVVRARRLQMRRSPDAPEPRFGLALAWMEVERFERAEAVLAALAETAPDFCRLWFHLGESRRQLGRPDAALAAFDRGIACDPGDGKTRFQRAELRWQRGEREAAGADFETLLGTSVADDARFATLHLRLAQRALARDDRAAADTHYARYRALGGTLPLEGS